MADNFASHGSGISGPADKHFLITAHASNPVAPKPRAIYCQADGTITMTGSAGTSLAYAMKAGQILPFRPTLVTSVGTGTFYGWE